MVRNKDYKMANEFVWNQFYSFYGGGPVLVRDEKNIYSMQRSKFDPKTPVLKAS